MCYSKSEYSFKRIARFLLLLFFIYINSKSTYCFVNFFVALVDFTKKTNQHIDVVGINNDLYTKYKVERAL